MILDLVGASHFAGNIECLTVEGRLLLVGVPSGVKADINLAQVRQLLKLFLTPIIEFFCRANYVIQNACKMYLPDHVSIERLS